MRVIHEMNEEVRSEENNDQRKFSRYQTEYGN